MKICLKLLSWVKHSIRSKIISSSCSILVILLCLAFFYGLHIASCVDVAAAVGAFCTSRQRIDNLLCLVVILFDISVNSLLDSILLAQLGTFIEEVGKFIVDQFLSSINLIDNLAFTLVYVVVHLCQAFIL